MKRSILMALAAMLLWPMPSGAQKVTLTAQEQPFWNEHGSAISEPCRFLADDAMAHLIADCRFVQEDGGRLWYFCLTKEVKKYLRNYMEQGRKERYYAKDSIDAVYVDSINAILIPYNPQLSGDYISFALRIGKEMKLTDAVRNELMANALKLSHLRKKNPCADIPLAEMEALQSVLNYRQCEQLIYSRNHEAATSRAGQMCGRMLRAGVAEPDDSASYAKAVYKYLQRENFIKAYYVTDNELMQNNLHDLYANKPKVIHIYDGLNTKRVVEKAHEKKVGHEFAW